MIRTALILALLVIGAPAQAACVMGLDGADRATAQYRMKRHVLDGQRLLAFVDINRERIPEYALEKDTTAIWVLELPEANVGFVIEVNDKCVTYQPEQGPLETIRSLLNEVARRVVGA